MGNSWPRDGGILARLVCIGNFVGVYSIWVRLSTLFSGSSIHVRFSYFYISTNTINQNYGAFSEEKKPNFAFTFKLRAIVSTNGFDSEMRFPPVCEGNTRARFDTSLAWHKLTFSMSGTELGKKWDRCLADTAIKFGKYRKVFCLRRRGNILR